MSLVKYLQGRSRRPRTLDAPGRPTLVVTSSPNWYLRRNPTRSTARQVRRAKRQPLRVHRTAMEEDRCRTTRHMAFWNWSGPRASMPPGTRSSPSAGALFLRDHLPLHPRGQAPRGGERPSARGVRGSSPRCPAHLHRIESGPDQAPSFHAYLHRHVHLDADFHGPRRSPCSVPCARATRAASPRQRPPPRRPGAPDPRCGTGPSRRSARRPAAAARHEPDHDDSFEPARQLWAGRFQGAISTQSHAEPGYPFGSPVPYCLDRTGRPVFVLSPTSPSTPRTWRPTPRAPSPWWTRPRRHPAGAAPDLHRGVRAAGPLRGRCPVTRYSALIPRGADVPRATQLPPLPPGTPPLPLQRRFRRRPLAGDAKRILRENPRPEAEAAGRRPQPNRPGTAARGPAPGPGGCPLRPVNPAARRRDRPLGTGPGVLRPPAAGPLPRGHDGCRGHRRLSLRPGHRRDPNSDGAGRAA